MPLSGWFARRSPPDHAGRDRIETWARAHGHFTEGTTLKVSEIFCPDPACPGDETVILVMEPGRRTRAVKISSSLAAVTEEAVRAAVLGAAP